MNTVNGTELMKETTAMNSSDLGATRNGDSPGNFVVIGLAAQDSWATKESSVPDRESPYGGSQETEHLPENEYASTELHKESELELKQVELHRAERTTQAKLPPISARSPAPKEASLHFQPLHLDVDNKPPKPLVVYPEAQETLQHKEATPLSVLSEEPTNPTSSPYPSNLSHSKLQPSKTRASNGQRRTKRNGQRGTKRQLEESSFLPPVSSANDGSAGTMMITGYGCPDDLSRYQQTSTSPKVHFQKRRIICFLIILLLSGLAIAIAVKYIPTKKELSAAAALAEDGSSVPPNEAVLSPAPTDASDTVLPQTPISALTDGLDMLLLTSNVPISTIESLGDSSSPQWKAMEWLSSYPDLETIEEWRKLQLFALATFFFAMEGEMWHPEIKNSWLQFPDECLWFSSEFGMYNSDGIFVEERAYNITPCGESGEFQALILGQMYLTDEKPYIPPEVTLLTSLAVLALPMSNIRVPLADFLPLELSELTSLRILNLHSNDLIGPIPTQVTSMASLLDLSLGSNRLSASIPSELGLMTGMTRLSLQNNHLSGTLPSELGLLSSLQKLSLGDNALNGNIPTEIGLLVHLTELVLSNNSFTGTIPNDLGLLSGIALLELSLNQLSGQIPSQLGVMTSVTRLSLDGNSLTGHIPSELGMLIMITHLDLYDNTLTGQIATELGLMKQITYLYLFENALTGTIPSELGQMAELKEMYLYSNSLSGYIPSELALMTSIEDLRLAMNNLSGAIPSELGLLKGMRLCYLFSNELAGSLPTDLGLMRGTTALDVEDNKISGPLPTQFGLMTALLRLNLNRNSLTGAMASEFGLLTNMVTLDLHSNLLWGSVPTELGLMIGLVDLALFKNLMSGPIPSELGLLSQLTMLSLGQNKLDGPIPSDLGMLFSLEGLELEDNLLTGDVPAELDLLVTEGGLSALSLAMNNMSGILSWKICSLGLYNSSTERGLSFDCDYLCGCSWCFCAEV